MAQNIEMQCKQSDGSYETLLPKTQASLLEINNTDLGNHLGGNTTVEGSLDYLSRMYAYWWKRVTTKYEEVYEDYSAEQQIFRFNETLRVENNATISIPFEWSTIKGLNFNSATGQFEEIEATSVSSIGTYTTVIKNGNWEGTFRQTDTPQLSSYGTYIKFRDNYYVVFNSDGKTYNSNVSLRFKVNPPSTMGLGEIATFGVIPKFGMWSGYGSRKISSRFVSSSVDYIYSFSRDAYPDSGTVGNYTYTYLGIPFENAMKDGPK